VNQNPNLASCSSLIIKKDSYLLDTSYSKVQTELPKIRFISVDNVERDQKKKNLLCYKYYNDNIIPKNGRKMLNKLYCEDYGIKNCDVGLNEYPLELYDLYDQLRNKSLNDGLLFFAEKSFLLWYNRAKRYSRYILVENGKHKHLKKIICRFDKKYTTMVQNRMNWLMYKYGNENAVLLTLTLNPSNFRNDKMCMWETITFLLNEFMTQLKRKLPDRVKYIRCIESMKGTACNDFVGRGNPHIHICFFGVGWIPKGLIDELWPYGFTFVNSTATGKKVRYPIHYITKYITKTYTENDADNTLNQSLVWFFNKNSYDHSKNLVFPLYKKGSGEWICDWVIEIEPLENQIVEMDAIFKAEEAFYKKPPPEVNC